MDAAASHPCTRLGCGVAHWSCRGVSEGQERPFLPQGDPAGCQDPPLQNYSIPVIL